MKFSWTFNFAEFESFAMTWIELMGRLLNTTAPKIIPEFKITFQLCSVASILLLTAYSSNLASKLTLPGYKQRWVVSSFRGWMLVCCWFYRIDTPKHFSEANLTWGCNTLHQPITTYSDVTVSWMTKLMFSCGYFFFFFNYKAIFFVHFQLSIIATITGSLL